MTKAPLKAKEMPSLSSFNWEDPFLLADSTWFDAELLNRVLARLPTKRVDTARSTYLPYEEGHKYYIGMDTSGGSGRDYAVIVVLRDDFSVAAVWRSNTASPNQQADMGAALSAEYGGATVLCEQNNYGKAVIARMRKLGARCWVDRATGKDFWTQGGRAGQTKKMVYSFARGLINDSMACSAAPMSPVLLNDPEVIRELMIVREDERGNIQAPNGKHDDHADAYVLALWCARNAIVLRRPKTQEDHERAKLARAMRGRTQ